MNKKLQKLKVRDSDQKDQSILELIAKNPVHEKLLNFTFTLLEENNDSAILKNKIKEIKERL